ncbi:DNA/RNA polymerase [Pilatotrama ljubarskyi]|nr:DNA/RNA polymerase [Pilatotrama ljubarskyi]
MPPDPPRSQARVQLRLDSMTLPSRLVKKLSNISGSLTLARQRQPPNSIERSSSMKWWRPRSFNNESKLSRPISTCLTPSIATGSERSETLPGIVGDRAVELKSSPEKIRVSRKLTASPTDLLHSGHHRSVQISSVDSQIPLLPNGPVRMKAGQTTKTTPTSTSPGRNVSSTSPSSPSWTQQAKFKRSRSPYSTLSSSRRTTLETSSWRSNVSYAARNALQSRTRSGRTFWPTATSISTRSSPRSTPSMETLEAQSRSENSNCQGSPRNQSGVLNVMDTGPWPGRSTNARFSSSTHTARPNSAPMQTRSTVSSQRSVNSRPSASSTSTEQSVEKLDGATDFSSTTSQASTTCTPCMLSEREQQLKGLLSLRRRLVDPVEPVGAGHNPEKPAFGTTTDDAHPGVAASDTSAQCAVEEIMSPPLASKRRRLDPTPITANKRPRHLRGFLWNPKDAPQSPLAELSESMAPLPRPPPSELENDTAWSTINSNPELFRIVSPVKVDVFERLLANHPNQPLVASVCRGFREGFWPFAAPVNEDFPVTWDESNLPLDEEAASFAQEYARDEEHAGRYSAPFTGALLPGMYSMPVHAVPKPHSDKMRFINNHSAGRFSLNSMIDKGLVGMRPDNVQDLARNLLHFRRTAGNVPVWLFKSDISNAYRLLPMHPLWQLKQVVTINGVRRVDRCCCFGNRGSPDLFTTFMALVLWIAINVRDIHWLLAYMDDAFSWEVQQQLVIYRPYEVALPAAQVRLLQLWDDIGVPHAPSKQLFGRQLVITGFLVDAEAMKITLPSQACSDLVAAIRSFLDNAPRRRRPLREWQRLLGWINWGLNVQPLLRPALQSSYDKITGLSIAHAPVYINASVTRDLSFIASIFEEHGGVHIMKASSWGPPEADLVVFCDACLTGLAFWIPIHNLAFVSDCPPAPPGLDDNIFWYEALTVVSALRHCISNVTPSPCRLAIYTDNLNTVQMFDSHRSLPIFTDLLLFASRLLIEAQNIDLRVWHVAGVHNTVADALSRGLFSVALQYAPSLHITTFIPPRLPLGASPQC